MSETKNEWISLGAAGGPDSAAGGVVPATDSAASGVVSASGVKSFPSSKRSKLSKKERKKRKLRKLEAKMLLAKKKEIEEFVQYACNAFDKMLAVTANINKTLDKIDASLDDIEASLYNIEAPLDDIEESLGTVIQRSESFARR